MTRRKLETRTMVRFAKSPVCVIEVICKRKRTDLAIYGEDTMWPLAVAHVSGDECEALARALTRKVRR